MGSEHSVVTALAELGRLEQERVEGERRQAAQRRVSALEQELARRASERFEHELAQARARLEAEHDAAARQWTEQLIALQLKLAAAEAGRDTLRAALAAQAQVQPQAQPRASKIATTLVALLACALCALAFAQQRRLHELEQRPLPAPAHAGVAPAGAPNAQALAVTPAATAVLPPGAPATKPAAASTAHRPAGSARGWGKVRPNRHDPRQATERDPLVNLDSCPEDDPTCGLEVGD